MYYLLVSYYISQNIFSLNKIIVFIGFYEFKMAKGQIYL